MNFAMDTVMLNRLLPIFFVLLSTSLTAFHATKIMKIETIEKVEKYTWGLALKGVQGTVDGRMHCLDTVIINATPHREPHEYDEANIAGQFIYLTSIFTKDGDCRKLPSFSHSKSGLTVVERNGVEIARFFPEGKKRCKKIGVHINCSVKMTYVEAVDENHLPSGARIIVEVWKKEYNSKGILFRNMHASTPLPLYL